jgi:hypothetical protein
LRKSHVFRINRPSLRGSQIGALSRGRRRRKNHLLLTKRQTNRNAKELKTQASTESSMTMGEGTALGATGSRVGQAEQRAEEGPYPHLSQSMAKPPDRSGHPFPQSPPPPAGAAPQAGFMHLFAATTPAMAGGGELTQSCLRSGLKEHRLDGGSLGGGGGGVVFRWMWRGQRTRRREGTHGGEARTLLLLGATPIGAHAEGEGWRGTKGTPVPGPPEE